jgi:phospholipid/cholesterol/gamma-HCH transport system ATP-binding protein
MSEAQRKSDYVRPDLTGAPAVVEVKKLVTHYGSREILHGIDLDVRQGEIMVIMGGSGSGKSTLLNTLLGLLRPTSGAVHILGQELHRISDVERTKLRQKMGVAFQGGALFSSMNVLENIMLPLREHTKLDLNTMRIMARLKMQVVNLSGFENLMPAELSGGMIKRAALARALALDPDIVFLDEPTSGLDPIGAAEFDELVAKLRDTMGLTVYMVTHDLDSLFSVCDRVAVLGNKKVLIEGTIADMLASEEPWVKSYFRGKRARQLDLAART